MPLRKKACEKGIEECQHCRFPDCIYRWGPYDEASEIDYYLKDTWKVEMYTRRILPLLQNGWSPQEIGYELGLTPNQIQKVKKKAALGRQSHTRQRKTL